MNISEQERDDILVFEMAGRIDTQGAEEMDQALQAAISEGKHKMILDLSAVNYISSAGLRTLADVLSQNREHEGDLKLVGLNQKVLRVLHIIGFDKFFTIYDATDAALADF